jgi:hypothetical protein
VAVRRATLNCPLIREIDLAPLPNVRTNICCWFAGCHLRLKGLTSRRKLVCGPLTASGNSFQGVRVCLPPAPEPWFCPSFARFSPTTPSRRPSHGNAQENINIATNQPIRLMTADLQSLPGFQVVDGRKLFDVSPCQNHLGPRLLKEAQTCQNSLDLGTLGT